MHNLQECVPLVVSDSFAAVAAGVLDRKAYFELTYFRALRTPGYFGSNPFDPLITSEESVECFFSDFAVRRNKSYRDRYQLMGRTISGRGLKIIFQLKPGNVVRIITGWSI